MGKGKTYGRRKSPASKVRRIIREVDVVLEVIDCRDHWGTRNMKIERYVNDGNSVLIFVLNKCDLVEESELIPLKRQLSGIAPTVFTSAKEKYGIGKLKAAIRRHAPVIPVKVGIVGYPNVGKSMLANALKGKRSAGVSPVAGFTKGKQWLKVPGDILLYDSPGVIGKEDEQGLAIIGAIDADKCKDPETCANQILDRLNFKNPEEIKRRYGVLYGDNVLGEIAKKRGKLLKGGIPDKKAAAKIVIREWTRGTLERFKKKESEAKHTDGEPSRKVR